MDDFKSMGDEFKKIIPELAFRKVINEYTCLGCREKVQVIESPIFGGERKGEKMVDTHGCRCADVKKARQIHKDHEADKVRMIAEMYSTVHPDLEQADFDNYDTHGNDSLVKALDMALDYADGFSIDKARNLILGGTYGLGKSHLSYAICKAVRNNGHNAIFISVPKLLTSLRSTYKASSKVSETDLIGVLTSVDLLVLDDIGAERRKKDEDEGESWAIEKMFEVIDGRLGRNTVYTTNLRSNELEEKIGARNYSRMCMNASACRMVGADYRKRGIDF